MIDSKSFMEFFEKQTGKKFVNVNTGRYALDIKKEDHVCGKCRYGAHGDGVTMFKEDIVCVNAELRRVTDFVMKNDTCEFWEAEEKESI